MERNSRIAGVGRLKATTRLAALALASLPVGTMLTTTAVLVAPQEVYAQTFNFSSVEVVGNNRVSTATILSYAGIARGQTVTGGELNDAFQALVTSGLFEDVRIEPRGSRLVISVKEYPVVSRISIEGNRVINDDVLAGLIKTTARRTYSPTTVEQDAAAIAQAYEAKGQLAAEVTPRIIRRSDNRVDVVFEITEGRGVEIERLSFVGNSDFSDSRLRRVLETKQAGALRFIIGRDTYNSERINFDRQVLTDFYRSRGYVDFRILSVVPEYTRERDAFFVTFTVEEGQSYDFGKLSASSEIPEALAAEFQEVINISSGETYSPLKIENVISRMEALATKKGLDFVRVDPRVTRNDRDLTLDIEFVLVEGPKIFVERIDIEGNQTTLDRVVRRQFDTVEGDPFNPREVREAASRIRALGFFSSADVQAREGTDSDRVIVDVNVEEAPTGSFSVGANYSVSNGLAFIASYSESNFLGRGQTLSLNFATKLDDGALSFNFVEPAFLGRDVAFGLGARYALSVPTNAEYEYRTAAITPSLTFPVAPNSRLRFDYTLASNDIFAASDGTPAALIQDDIDLGRQLTSAAGYDYTFDNRRSGLNPTAGIVLRFGQEYAGLGGDVDFLRTSALAAAETRVFNDDVTLRATVEGGVIDGQGDATRVIDRFALGPNKLRGFEPGGIGPRQDGQALGGNKFAVARLEAEFPLGLPEEYGISGGLFYDVGSLWDVDNAGSVDDGRYWRHVVGATVFWETPLGPLRFNFTKALKKETGDLEQRFDLTISTQF